MHRRTFIRNTAVLSVAAWLPCTINRSPVEPAPVIMTVNGPVAASSIGFTLSHEHIMVDFIGAAQVSGSRYKRDEVFEKALPFLLAAKKRGCETLIDCTPDYIGRDAELLKKLSDASGVRILTNTGYYGASKEKYFPQHTFTETADQLAVRWISEWENGINGTGIKPGFIKSGVDNFPLTDSQEKVITAAALTHLATGLTIGIHTGNGKAAFRELELINKQGVDGSAWIWIHAQNEKDRSMHVAAARSGGWISFDGFNEEALDSYVGFLNDMKAENLLSKVLISHDAGWYQVGEPNGGKFRDYNAVMDLLLPELKKNKYSTGEIDLVFRENPAKAFAVSRRLLKNTGKV